MLKLLNLNYLYQLHRVHLISIPERATWTKALIEAVFITCYPITKFPTYGHLTFSSKVRTIFDKNYNSFFFWIKKGDSCVAVIVPRPTVQLGKPMGTINSNWSSETPNLHTPQALLVFGTFRNCNYSPHENSNLGCGESPSSHLPVVPHPLVVPLFYFIFNHLSLID